jgi:hypothetical protein
MTFFLKRFTLPLMNLALIVGFIGSVHAVDFTVYTDKTAFLAALSPGYYTETFSTLAVNTLLSSPIVLNSGPNQFEVSTGSGDFYNAANGSDVWLSTDIRSESVNFSAFANSPTAIGGYFFLTNSSGSPNTGTINANLNSGAATSSITTASSTNFIGFVSTNNTPLSSLLLTTSATTWWVTANDVIVGKALPVSEPSTYILALIASGVMIRIGRNRSRQV